MYKLRMSTMNMLTGVTTGVLYLVLCFDPGVLGQYYLPTTTTTTPWCLGPAGYADAPADQWTDPAERAGCMVPVVGGGASDGG